jgi:hypothetical protein
MNRLQDWTPVTQKWPPPETMVEAFHRGEIHRMYRRGRLWLDEEQKAYVCWTPEYWRPLPQTTATAPTP